MNHTTRDDHDHDHDHESLLYRTLHAETFMLANNLLFNRVSCHFCNHFIFALARSFNENNFSSSIFFFFFFFSVFAFMDHEITRFCFIKWKNEQIASHNQFYQLSTADSMEMPISNIRASIPKMTKKKKTKTFFVCTDTTIGTNIIIIANGETLFSFRFCFIY